MPPADEIPRVPDEIALQKLEREAAGYWDRLLATELALWTVIMAMDGLLLAATSILAALSEVVSRFGLMGSLACSLYSGWLIFQNFLRRRGVYRNLVELPEPAAPGDEPGYVRYAAGLEARKAQHQKEEDECRTDEKRAILLLGVSILLFVVSIYARRSIR